MANRSGMVTTSSGLKLTVNEEMFCRAMVDLDGECAGQPKRAYAMAYNPTDPKAAWVSTEAGKLMKKDNVKKRIDELIEQLGFNNSNVDFEHLKVIKQDRDLSNKMKAISEYNRLKGRGKQSGQEVHVNIIDFTKTDGSDNITVQVQTKEEAVPAGDPIESSEE